MSTPFSNQKPLSLLDAVSEIVFRVSTKTGEILEFYAPKHLELWIPREKILGFNIANIDLEGIPSLISSWKNGAKESVLNNSFETLVKGRNFRLSVKYSGENEIFIIVQDITELKKSQSKIAKRDELIKNIEQGVSSYVGQKFFDNLAIQLSKTLKADYVIIGQSSDCLEVDTISFVMKGEIADEFSYPVEDVPCKETLASGGVCYINKVYEKFPKSTFFIENKTEAYIGSALTDSSNKPIGVMVVMFDKPVTDGELYSKIINIFCARASSELTRTQTELALKKSEQKYKNIFETVKDVYYRTDADNIIRLVTPSIEALSGYKASDIIGKKVIDFQVSSERYHQNYEKLLSTGKLSNEVVEMRRADGEVIYVSSNVQAEFDKDGRFNGAAGTIRDVTTAYKQKLIIEESELKYRNIFESITDVYYRTDDDSNITIISPSIELLTGYKPDELIGKKGAEIYANPSVFKQKRNRLLKNGELKNEIIQLKKTNGEIVDVEANVKIAYSPNGDFNGSIGVLRDVTTALKQKLIIEESEKRYKNIFESITDVYYRTDANNILTIVSPSIVSLIGHKAEDVIGTNIVDMHVRAEDYFKKLKKIKEHGKVINEHIQIVRSDGQIIDIESNTHANYNKRGEFIGTTGMARDVTESLRQKDLLLESEYNYRAIFDTINDVFYRTDANNTVSLISPSVESLLGYKVEDVIGKKVIDFHADPTLYSEKRKELESSGKFVGVIAQLKRKNGEVIDVEINVYIQYTKEGAFDGTVGTLRDITVSLKQASLIEKSEEKYRSIFNNITDVYFESDENYIITTISPSVESITGHKIEEVVGKSVYAFHEHPKESKIGFEIFLKDKTLNSILFNLKKADGQIITVENNVQASYDDKGNFKGLKGMFRDRTESIKNKKSLEHSEEKYRNIFNNITDVFFQTNSNDEIEIISPSVEEITGYTIQEAIGVPSGAFFLNPEDERALNSHLKEFGSLRNAETILVKKDKSQIHVSINSKVRRNQKGEYNGSIGIFRDITDSKISQIALKESEKKFRSIFNSISDIYYETDENHIITVISPSVEKISGFPKEALLGKKVTQFHKDPSEHKSFIEEITKKGYIHNYQFEMINSVGTSIFVELNVNAKYDTEGKYVGAVGMLRDVSQPKKVEKILRESEEKFRSVFESITDVYYKTDADRTITMISPSIEAFSGYKPEEIIGRKSSDFLIDEAANETLRQQLMEKGLVNNFVLILKNKKGKNVTVSCNVKAILNNKGNYTGTVGLLRDITGVIAAQKKQDEIAQNYKHLFENSNDAIFISDVKTAKLIDVNNKAISLLGYTKEEFIGMHILNLRHPNRRKKVSSQLDDYRKSGRAIFESVFTKKNGEEIAIEGSAQIMNIGGKAINQSIIRDISNRKKNELILLESEKKYRGLFENSSDAVVISDPVTRKILDVNQKMVEMMGYSREELLSKTTLNLRLKENKIQDDLLFNSFLKKGEAIYESTFKTSTGESIEIEGSAKVITIENRKVIQAFLRDITDRKREEELLKLNKTTLEKVAKENDIFDILNETCLGIEEIFTDMICSVLIYDKANNCLNFGAGPKLPKYYTKAVNNFPVGPSCCSCGTAAYTGETVIVTDIANDSLWESAADLAARAKLKACWSIPMMSSDNSILGTFAVYYKKVKTPTKNEIEIVNNFSNLIGIALENDINKINLLSKEKRYRKLVNNSPVGILIHTKGVIKFVNDEVLRIGKAENKEQLLGKNVMDFVIPTFKSNVESRIKILKNKNGVVPSLEEQFLCLDGSIIDVEVMGTQISFQGKASSQLVFYDITKRKKAQNKLAESEVRYRQLVDNSPVGILIHTKGIVKFVNKEVLKIIKFKSKDEIIGKSGMTFMLPKYKTEIQKRINKTQLQEKSFSRVEEQFYCTDGSLVDVEVMGMPVVYQGEPSTQLVFQDITERKKAELELKNSEEKYRSLNDSVFDGIIIANQEGNIISWNHGAEKIFGYTQEQVIEQSLTMIMPAKYRKRHLAGLKKYNNTKESKIIGNVVELEGLSKDGKIFPVEISFSNWEIEGKQFFSAIIRDITERKAIENKQKNLNEYLIKQNKQLEEFAYITSHNLRAPITNINSLITLQEKDKSEETNDFVFKQLKIVSDNLFETINELTEVLETSWELNKKKQKLKFSSILDKIKNSLSRRIVEEDVKIHLDFKQNEIVFPKVYLESIMQNLVLNAIKYRNTKTASWVKISTEIINGEIVLHVEDNGLGIDLKRHGRKLFGLRKTFHENEDARGVGLFITKAQIDSMGGRIEVTSEVGVGTKFSVYFSSSSD